MNITPNDEVKRIELELTSICNLGCPLCMRQLYPELITNTKYRPAEEIIKQIRKYPNLKYVTLAGPISEPTTHPEFFDILQYLIKKKIEISLFINGDTHSDRFYKKLGIIFRSAIGHVYFTVCGSTQELHEKYRVNSKLSRVIRRFKIVEKLSKKAIMTWLVFNYNQEDYEQNKHMFDGYTLQSFNTLPVQEHLNLNIDIHLPEPQHTAYKTLNREATDIECPAQKYKFHLVDHNGDAFNCTLHKMHGDLDCFECGKKNSKILQRNKIYHLAEAEDEESEIPLRL